MTDKYAIWDIDETLISASIKDISTPFLTDPNVFYIQPIIYPSPVEIWIRKHFHECINSLKMKGYKFIIWSAGEETYVKAIISVLFKNVEITHLFTREHTTKYPYTDNGRTEYEYVKILKNIEQHIPGFKRENCRLIDDNPCHIKEGQEHLIITCPKFSRKDTECSYLRNLPDIIDAHFSLKSSTNLPVDFKPSVNNQAL